MHEKGGSLCLGAATKVPCVYRLIADMNPYTFILFCECLLKTVASYCSNQQSSKNTRRQFNLFYNRRKTIIAAMRGASVEGEQMLQIFLQCDRTLTIELLLPTSNTFHSPHCKESDASITE